MKPTWLFFGYVRRKPKKHIWLVVRFNHLKKYDFVNGKDDIPYMKWKKTCSKPPTSYDIPFKMVIYKSLLNPMKKPYLKTSPKRRFPMVDSPGNFQNQIFFPVSIKNGVKTKNDHCCVGVASHLVNAI